jgi:hypothetical protein
MCSHQWQKSSYCTHTHWMLYRKKERKKKRFQRIGSTKQNENEECQYRNSGKSLQHNLTKQDPPAERKTNEKRKKKKVYKSWVGCDSHQVSFFFLRNILFLLLPSNTHTARDYYYDEQER